MKTVEIKTIGIELSRDEKEILSKASDILNELYKKDINDNIFNKILREKDGGDGDNTFYDFNDVSFILSLLYERKIL